MPNSLDRDMLALMIAFTDVLDRRPAPRWVMVHRIGREGVVFHDPRYPPEPDGDRPGGRDRLLPIPVFRRMTLRGKSGRAAAVIVRKGPGA